MDSHKKSDAEGHSRLPLSHKRMWGILVLVLLAVSAAMGWRHIRPGAAASEALPKYGPVPYFKLIDHRGKPVTQKDLLGRVWVADFIFTNCAGVCPMMTARMSDLRDLLAGLEDVRLVSISVDPQRDTPQRLSQYVKRFDLEDRRWHFLTGKASVIASLSRDAFHLPLGDAPADGNGGPNGYQIQHSRRFVLVDRRGRIRGYYLGTDQEGEKNLPVMVRHIRRLLEEPPL